MDGHASPARIVPLRARGIMALLGASKIVSRHAMASGPALIVLPKRHDVAFEDGNENVEGAAVLQACLVCGT